MSLVYAMPQATNDGWTAATIGLLASSAVLLVGSVVIESRSRWPLLPLQIFRLRTLRRPT